MSHIRGMLGILGLAALLPVQATLAQTIDCTSWETVTSGACANACSDGVDNDGDRYVDRLTAGDHYGPGNSLIALGPAPGCVLELKGVVPAGHTNAGAVFDFCHDGIDNDGDGFTDTNPAGTPFGNLGPDQNCAVETNWGPYNACTDGINNDGNVNDNSPTGGFPVELIDAVAPTGANPDPYCTGEVLCDDGVDNDGDGQTDGADSDCMCLNQASGFSGSTVCTANDFTIAFTANPQEVVDGCINPSDKVTVSSLQATLTAHQPARYDLGLWIALASNADKTTTAQNGPLCMRQMFTPVLHTGYSTGTIYPPGPYPTLEPHKPHDLTDGCGEIQNQQTAVWDYPTLVTLPCSDFGSLASGFVDLGQCGSWDNNDATICSSVTQALPNTKSKCQCQNVDSNIPAPNVATSCTNFTTPTWTVGSGTALEVNEQVRFELSFSNAVTGCSPTALPISGDPFGRTRCGTVSFMRYAIGYVAAGLNADAYGDFLLDNGTTPVPTCPSVAYVTQGSVLGLLCNDTIRHELIWAPHDPVAAGTWAVISPFTGNLTLPFQYRLTTSLPTNSGIVLNALPLWDPYLDGIVDNTPDGSISTAEAVTIGTNSKLQTTCVDCGCTTASLTTPVTIASFTATRDGGRATVEWSTATEVGHVGFNVVGRTADGWVRLNRDPIAAAAGDTLEPQTYREFVYVPEDVAEIAIEELDVRGHTVLHSPQELAGGGRELEAEPIENDLIRTEHEALEAERETGRRHAAAATINARKGALAVSAAAAVKAGAVIDLKVTRDGLYRVTYEDLLAAGFDLAGIQAARIGVTSRGAGVPITVGGQRTFGPGAYVEFYGQALDTLYTGDNVYRLEVDASKPARAAVDATAPSGAAAASYTETREFERNRAYTFASPTGDPWYDTRMLTYTTAREWSFPFTVDGLVDGAAPARLAVRMFGGTDTPVKPDHHVVVTLNGVTVGSYTFEGLADQPVAVDLPAGTLREGANTLVLRLPGDTGAEFDLVNLESWSVSYPRRVAATADALTITGAAGRYDVAGLTAGKVVAYRVSGGTTTLLSGTTVAASGGGFVASLPGSAAKATYLVATEAALLKPAIAAARPYTDITSGTAQYLVISHPDFIASLAPLVAARQAQGLQVRVVDVQDVWAQFGNAIVDPAALRTYIGRAVASMGTEYVLLVGGDSYDYRNFLGAGSLSFIPSLYVATDEVVRFAPSDPALADRDGDGTPDVAIGRLPVRTRAELDTLIGKILAYQNKAYGARAVFASDRTDAGANVPFAAASDKLAARLQGDWTVSRAYLGATTLAEARAALIGGINAGAALTNYVGHSGPSAWTFSGLFNTADAAALANAGKPTVVTQWGCWNTYYVNPTTESLATRLLLAGDRGAAAVLGATTLTTDVDENDLGVLLAGRVTQPGTTIGKAILDAKKALKGKPAQRADVLLGWVLLGDPALVVQP